MGDLSKKYGGDVVAELLGEGEYELARKLVEGLTGSNSPQDAVRELQYADPVNRDRVFEGYPIALLELDGDPPVSSDDELAFATEWSREND